MNFFLNKGLGHGNSGVEHAQFYRQQAFSDLHQPVKLVYSDLLPKLHEHMREWHLAESDVINLYDYLMAADPEKYLEEGLTESEQESYDQTVLSDFSKTNRVVIEQATSGYIIRRMKEKVFNEKKQLYIVSDAQVVLTSGKRRLSWSYRLVDETREMTAIFLENFQGKDYYFQNFYQLLAFFMDNLQEHFGPARYFFDRGLDYDEYLVANRKQHQHDQLVAVVHANHRLANIGNRIVFNQFYQYLANHISAYDAVVVATRHQQVALQSDLGLLGYDVSEKAKVHAVPVGFVKQVRDGAKSSVDSDRTLRLVTASRLHQEKHIDQIILAVAALRRAGVQADLTIYGSGQEKKALEQLIQEQGLEQNVHLAGLSQNLATDLETFDLYVSASYSEGFGLTYLEALSQRLPIISYANEYGAQELVSDGYNGYLAPFSVDDNQIPESVDALVSAIIKAESQLEQLSQGAGLTAQGYLKEAVTKSWQKLLEDLHEN
ncbi:glycosyltransferase [Fructobacillus durionis]|uniref:Glycosyltransferase involved in cell wall bisynthesis n=1 Tax=Fructobacillus durionis TaxID=283737 RepID=A0A1I1FEZ9_9LACO|nr:glycosyltransferase [Fructobacillus durionis]SFB95640.1 Glycosyltransferase involved in cell wall bisynthesis [Fructobacillus durionis]